MSYYTNAPREFTPSVFKAKATGTPVPDMPADKQLPDVLNVCHRTRHHTLSSSHPYTFARLREAEHKRALRDAGSASGGSAPMG